VLKRLLYVLAQENVAYDDSGLDSLIFTAEGDMRQALNNAQATSAGFGKITSTNVMKVCDQVNARRRTRMNARGRHRERERERERERRSDARARVRCARTRARACARMHPTARALERPPSAQEREREG
jgi:DNA polymerase III delta prime subunit